MRDLGRAQEDILKDLKAKHKRFLTPFPLNGYTPTPKAAVS